MAKRILVVTQHFWPENFRINDMVEGFLQDGLEVDVLCGLPNYPKGEWFDGYSAQGPWEEHYGTAQVFRAKEWPRKGNTSVNIFLNYVSWPLYAWRALDRLPGGYDAVFCFNTSPVLMCWPAIRYAKKHKIPFTSYVLEHAGGVDMNRSSRSQATQGTPVSAEQMQPGDLVFYANGSRINHVGLYIGDGQIVHASTEKTGIKISPWTYRNPVKIVNVLG